MRLTCVVEDSVGYDSELWAEHGLSFLIESAGQRLLLDAGQSSDVLVHNMRSLGLWAKPLHHLALSHAHNDHSGGVPAVLAHWPDAVVHAHPCILEPRYSTRDQDKAVGLSAELLALGQSGAWRLSQDSVELIPNVWTTGTIKERPYPLGRSPQHYVERDGQRITDDYADDLSLMLQVKGGVALLCGCCHAGLRNTILRLREMSAQPLVAVIGGLHLVNADAAELAQVSALLEREGGPALYLCHCTGAQAIQALRSSFGDLVHACSAGAIIELPDASAVSG